MALTASASALAGMARQACATRCLSAASVKNTDAFTFSKIALQRFRTQLQTNLALTTDATTKYHYQDLADKIKQALDPK